MMSFILFLSLGLALYACLVSRNAHFRLGKLETSKVICLDISYNLDEIDTWIDNDCFGDLLATDKVEVWSNVNKGNRKIIKYRIDILPHPNGVDSFFYHHHTHSFSNHLDASDFLKNTSLPISKGFKSSKNIFSVGWTLSAGTLAVMVSTAKDDGSRVVLLTPTDEIRKLQMGNILEYDRNDGGFSLKKIIDIDDSEVAGKAYRDPSWLGGKGVRFMNSLCRVQIYLPGPMELYHFHDSN